jgi:hypothetical protein
MVWAVWALAGCEAEPPAPPPTDPELRAELGIDDDVVIRRIDLTAEDRVGIVPRETVARPGDVVQFVALDHRVYLIVFDAAGLGAAEGEFLRGTGQDSPAPLVERGARLVVTFADAPPGNYAFRVETGGSSAPGVIRVEAR